jgi:hypothetical protein
LLVSTQVRDYYETSLAPAQDSKLT